MMAREEKLAYQRGYHAGSNGRWPLSKLPLPPDLITARLLEATRSIAMAVDAELARLSDDDEWQATLGPLVDEAYESLEAYREDVRSLESKSKGKVSDV